MRYLRFWLMNGLLAASLVGLVAGGAWAWTGFLAAALLSTVIDELAPDETAAPAAAPPARLLDVLLFLTLPLVLANLVALAHLVGAASAGRGITGAFGVAGAILGVGLLTGAAGTNVAHELIHRPAGTFAYAVGRWLLAFSFDTTFAIEHVHGHHRRVGTPEDPATARRGEPAWTFVWRATRDGNRSAWAIERARLDRRGLAIWSRHNRVLTGQLQSLALAGLVVVIGGVPALGAFLLTAAQGKAYLELVDYIEHYGIVRVPGSPVEARHAWDSQRRVSQGLLYNLPRHAHHHMHAGKPFWRLETEPAAPVMPFGYMTMILIALLPPLWRRVMHPRLDAWGRDYASPAERALLGR